MNDLGAGFPHLKPSRRRVQWQLRLQRWHRTAGLYAAFFLLLLAGTGLLLMYSDALKLPTTQVSAPWLMRWYGIRPPAPPHGYPLEDHWLSQVGRRLYLDTREIDRIDGVLLGAFALSEAEWVAITDAQWLVLDPAGQVLERIGRESGLPEGLQAVGRDAAGQIVLATSTTRFRYDSTLGEFVAASTAGDVQWSAGSAPPPTIAKALDHGYRGEGLPLERVVLDLHSGRLFGRLGELLVTLASLALVALACTGVVARIRRGRGSAR